MSVWDRINCVPRRYQFLSSGTRSKIREEEAILRESVNQLSSSIASVDTQLQQLQNYSNSTRVESEQWFHEFKTIYAENTRLLEACQVLRDGLTNQNDLVASLQTEIERLREQTAQLQQQNQQHVAETAEFKRSFNSFANNVVDLEEKLFKTYCEYKTENKVQHRNNLLAVFLRCDRDGDGVLNEREFNIFRQQIAVMYGQQLTYPGQPVDLEEMGDML